MKTPDLPILSVADLAPPGEAVVGLPVPRTPHIVVYGIASDPNPVYRPVQQDAASVLCGELLHPTAGRTRFVIADVFDGVGGGEGGEIASGTAANSLPVDIAAQLVAMTDIEQVPDIVREAVWRANRSLFARAGGNGRMGTTLVLALYIGSPWLGDHVWVAHVGDSRAYAVLGSDTDLVQITRDHSVVQQRVDAGEITQEQALLCEDANHITAALGAAPSPAFFDIAYQPLNGRPIALALMTDGVWAPLRQAAVYSHAGLPDFGTYIATLLRGGAPQQAAAQMVADALRLGSSDNATCVVLDIRPLVSTPVPDAGSPLISRDAAAPDTDLLANHLSQESQESEEPYV
jgi:protein phosphatase